MGTTHYMKLHTFVQTLHHYLQPRPKLPKPTVPMRPEFSSGKGQSQGSRPGPYTKGTAKGKSKGKPNRVQWLTEMVVKGREETAVYEISIREMHPQ